MSDTNPYAPPTGLGSKARTRRRSQGWLSSELEGARHGIVPPKPPESPTITGQPVSMDLLRARAEYERGLEALRVGRTSEAWNFFAVSQGFAAGDALLVADTLAGQGLARLRQNNLDAARDAFYEALRYNPAHVEARIGMVDLALLGRYPENTVALLYETLTVIDEPGRRAEVHLRLVTAYRRQGREALARPHLRAAWGLAAPIGSRGKALLLFPLTLDRWQWQVVVAALLLAIVGFVTERLAGPAVLGITLGVWAGLTAFNWALLRWREHRRPPAFRPDP